MWWIIAWLAIGYLLESAIDVNQQELGEDRLTVVPATMVIFGWPFLIVSILLGWKPNG